MLENADLKSDGTMGSQSKHFTEKPQLERTFKGQETGRLLKSNFPLSLKSEAEIIIL